MKVYLVIRDSGDGSASIRFHRTSESAESWLEEEEYYMNEGQYKELDVTQEQYEKLQFDN